MAVGLHLAEALYNLRTAAVAEELRIEANEVMGRAFEQVDLIIAATNPGPAFPAEPATSQPQVPDRGEGVRRGRRSLRPARRAGRGAGRRPAWCRSSRRPSSPRPPPAFPDLVNMGALTIISNIYGNPAVSIPAGTVDGLPVGMQVLAPHHRDDLLFDVALSVERERPWPMVAPAAGAGGRLMALRVVGAGLGRTGTHSLKLALEQLLGGRCHHMSEVFGNEAERDVWRAGVPAVSRPTSRPCSTPTSPAPTCRAACSGGSWWTANPDALVLLSVRATSEDWWRSASQHDPPVHPHGHRWGRPMDGRPAAAWAERFSDQLEDRDAMVAAYERHNDEVRAGVPAERLLEWQPGDGWEPICERLGVPVPDEPFPKTNSTEDFRAMAGLPAARGLSSQRAQPERSGVRRALGRLGDPEEGTPGIVDRRHAPVGRVEGGAQRAPASSLGGGDGGVGVGHAEVHEPVRGRALRRAHHPADPAEGDLLVAEVEEGVVGAGVGHRLHAVAEDRGVEGAGGVGIGRAQVLPHQGARFVDHLRADVLAVLPHTEHAAGGIRRHADAADRPHVAGVRTMTVPPWSATAVAVASTSSLAK